MISVIVATYNSEATLPRCLASLAEQEDADFEVLIADGGSTDATSELIAASGKLVAWSVSEPDRGVYDAWNKAIPHAQGEWIMFLGSDDWLDASDTLNELARVAAAISRREPRHAFVYGHTALMEQGTVIEDLGVAGVPGNRIDPDADIPFSHTGLLHHRSLFEDFGLFDANFRSAGDYEFLLRTTLQGTVRCFRANQTVARMASGGMSNRASSRARHCREMVQARIKHGLKPQPKWLRGANIKATCLSLLDRFAGPRTALASANLYRRIKGKKARLAV